MGEIMALGFKYTDIMIMQALASLEGHSDEGSTTAENSPEMIAKQVDMMERALLLVLKGWSYQIESSGASTEMIEMYSAMYESLGKFTSAVRGILMAMLGVPSSEIPSYLEEVSKWLRDEGVTEEIISGIANKASSYFGAGVDFNEGNIERFVQEAGEIYIAYLSAKM